MTLFAATLFLSAVLLFAVEPMFGKMILPLFGGSPAVWMASLVFFQIGLLAGYAYAHAAIRWLGVRRAAAIQLFVLALPLAVLPIHVFSGASLSPGRPLGSIFFALAASIGLPFFAVATSGPMLQRWFGSTGDRHARDPYFFYAASNLGSLGALLAYPLVVEPIWPLTTQSRFWTDGYLALIALTGACVAKVWRSNRGTRVGGGSGPAVTNSTAAALDPAPSWRVSTRWVALAFVPSSLMLSVTTHVTTDIAAVPLLWVLPLATYLATFVLTFARRPLIPQAAVAALLPLAVMVPLATMVSGTQESIGYLPFHLIALFFVAMFCHGELARTRPGVEHLTAFYLWLSIGGAVGGLFNALIAPLVFRTLVEYPAALVAAVLLRPPSPEASETGRTRLTDLAVALAAAAVTLGLEYGTEMIDLPHGARFLLAVFTVPYAIALVFWRRTERTGLVLAATACAAMAYPDWQQSVLLTERSFYGVHRVADRGAFRVLMHGTTAHGSQSTQPARQCDPISYYYPTGPFGDLFLTFVGRYQKSNIGIVGLGIGASGGYAKPGQAWTFYEINPVVEQIARDPRYFTFLRDCVPQARVVLGDARISLARQADGLHDVLVLDAFNSDALPVHLVTHEAVSLYLRKLAPGGVLVFNVSNRFLNLQAVLARLARDAHLVAYLRADTVISPAEFYNGKVGSLWVVMARQSADLGSLLADRRWIQLSPNIQGRVWTDDYSNVFETLRLRR